MAEKTRADIALVRQNLCESRERAQAAIMEGRVFFGDKRINKASECIPDNEPLILKSADNDYVSRGALKLEKAVKVFHADLENRIIMDIGSSTGGFTDVCLRNGAKRVYAIDVGYGQLDWKLRNDPRVTVMERTNARFIQPEMFPEKPTVTVIDVSFISIRLILPSAIRIIGESGVIYSLIKPQFEAGRENVGKNGVVRDPAVHESVIRGISDAVEQLDWRINNLDYSPITGPKGNIEFISEIRHKRFAGERIPSEKIAQTVEKAHKEIGRS